MTSPFLFLQFKIESIRNTNIDYYGKENYSRTYSIGVSFGIVKTVSPNGRIRGLPQRRWFESNAIPFSFFRTKNTLYYERKLKAKIKRRINMKQIYTLLVVAEDTNRVESILNSLRIGLNDWDKSKIFEVAGANLVSYTILCEEDQFTYIVNQMNATRVY